MPSHRRGTSSAFGHPAGPGNREKVRQRRHWPLPGTIPTLPPPGGPGSFWEDRGDRRHAGLDLYAPAGSAVVSIEGGNVVSTGVFTSPDGAPYWNVTYQVTIAHDSGIFCRYAELGELAVRDGVRVDGGQVIGCTGEVLNPARVGTGSPAYTRRLADLGRTSMLHLEVSASVPGPDPGYLGGNWFFAEKPAHLLDPGLVLRDLL